jgi:hypothetical protein
MNKNLSRGRRDRICGIVLIVCGIAINQWSIALLSPDKTIECRGAQGCVWAFQLVAIALGVGCVVNRERTLVAAALACLIGGIGLLVLNVVGLSFSLRNSAIYAEDDTIFRRLFKMDDITMSPEQVKAAFNIKTDSTKAYISLVNDAVNRGLAHCWREESAHKYNLRIPAHENFILFLAAYVYPKAFMEHELVDYRKAIERGIGLCSQHCIVMSEVLCDRGIPSMIVCLTEHVVITAQVDRESDTWWVYDPDFGVVIPYDITAIQRDPGIVRPYYARKDFDDKISLFTLSDEAENDVRLEKVSPRLCEAFRKNGCRLRNTATVSRENDRLWHIRDGGQTWGVETRGDCMHVFAASVDDLIRTYGAPYRVRRNAADFWGPIYWVEKASYVAMWVLPICMIGFGLQYGVRRVRATSWFTR